MFLLKTYRSSLSRGVLIKKCFENMQQTYRRTTMPNCDSKSEFSRIQSECRKIRTRKNPIFGHISHSVHYLLLDRVLNTLYTIMYILYNFCKRIVKVGTLRFIIRLSKFISNSLGCVTFM